MKINVQDHNRNICVDNKFNHNKKKLLKIRIQDSKYDFIFHFSFV